MITAVVRRFCPVEDLTGSPHDLMGHGDVNKRADASQVQ